MKKLLIAIIFLCLSASSFSQITRRTEIYYKSPTTLSATAVFDENDQLERYFFTLISKNQKYEHINDMISLYSGSENDVYEYLSATQEYIDMYMKADGPDVTRPVLGTRISNKKALGTYFLIIQCEDGLVYIKAKDFIKIKDAFMAFCKKNDIQIP